ncbi:MAG: cytochrome-c oxidase, cbb3-type subunit I [Verrucomicrobiales bacterium]
MNTAQKVTIEYDDRSVRRFLIATLLWGVVAMLVGVIAAFQLNFWQMNGKFLEALTFGLIRSEGIEFLSFGRLRPLHTNAAIFAFVGNMMFAGIYYSTQRLCKARMASDWLSSLHFWGWQAIIVAAAITLPAGLTRGKEYAELIWPINVAVAVIWVVFALNFFLTLKRRNEPSLYVALWFYIATIITVAMLYIVNHLSLPTSLTHSYPIFGGVQDALVQWWYGHNAVAFFLTTPILGIMYYFMPKAADRPVYSYRLSIVHFWSLVFIYIWAGPHHLLHTGLPHWLQALGMTFSLMLWAPSWGGMLNGLLTLRGAWGKLRTDPVIKFFAAGVTFYGMATFEGPLLSIRAVNQLSHYTDWTIGHVHSGTLGWNGFMTAGMIYWLVPRLWKTKLHRESWANMHFWLGLVGILFYVGAMWISGITQGLMLGQVTDEGTPKYRFLETLDAIRPMMLFRAIGGTLYLASFILMVVNVWLSVRGKATVDGRTEVVIEGRPSDQRMGWFQGALANAPVLWSLAGITAFTSWFVARDTQWLAWPSLALGLIVSVLAVKSFKKNQADWSAWHEKLLHNWVPFTTLAFIAVAIGGAVQILPTVILNRSKNVEDRIQQLYTPLELAGRDLYVSEGCYNCHSQQIRTLAPDILRYGDWSRLGESIFDHPFQWGSKRTGPDLARQGTGINKKDNLWHYQHLVDPRQISQGSNMPSYHWLEDKKIDLKGLPAKIAVQVRLGVPYEALNKDEIQQLALEQGLTIARDLKERGAYVDPDSQMVAMIAYLQKLGHFTDVRTGQPYPPPAPASPAAASAAPSAPPAPVSAVVTQ